MLTVKDFINFYNLYNDKKNFREIYEEMIVPLMDKEIIIKGRETNSLLKKVVKLKIFTCHFLI